MLLETLRIHLDIAEECGNLIVVNDRGELIRNIDQNKKSRVLQ